MHKKTVNGSICECKQKKSVITHNLKKLLKNISKIIFFTVYSFFFGALCIIFAK